MEIVSGYEIKKKRKNRKYKSLYIYILHYEKVNKTKCIFRPPRKQCKISLKHACAISVRSSREIQVASEVGSTSFSMDFFPSFVS